MIDRQQLFSDVAQETADAIKAVLEIDVTVMDQRMLRIAGTGIYKDKLGHLIGSHTAFNHCMNNNRIYLIEDARHDETCKQCEHLSHCNEMAEMCVPIKGGGTVIGVIGAIAFTQEQKERMLKNKFVYINFIEKMAVLLESKYSELLFLRKNTVLTSRLAKILNSMQEAVLLLDIQGTIVYSNDTFDRLLKENAIADRNLFAQAIFDKIFAIRDACSFHDRELNIYIGDRTFTFVTALQTIQYDEDEQNSSEYLIKLQDASKYENRLLRYSQKNEVRIMFDNIIGQSRSLLDVKDFALRAAHADSNVLIMGESGTGKELMARAIHNASFRRENAFVAINCGGIPDGLLESELFGHEKGSFTGALTRKIGKFEVADGGTIFLDEISEMPFTLQVKLLRIIQERELCRIGSNNVKKIDIRIIAATNANLSERITQGLFREDLYYRLNTIPLYMPSLKDRAGDVSMLAETFVRQFAHRMGKHFNGLTEDAQALLNTYLWPGNVRELQNVMEYAVNFETSEWITEETIACRLQPLRAQTTKIHLPTGRTNNMDAFEREMILSLIHKHKGEKHKQIISSLCQELSVSRPTLYRRLKKYKIILNEIQYQH
jgi:transcriptional regulator with PAS, ATPase and Fis domain